MAGSVPAARRAGCQVATTAARTTASATPTYVAASVGETPNNYGYTFWTHNGEAGVPPDLFMSRGHNLNHSYVIPSLDLVVVRQGNDNRRVAGDTTFATALIQKIVAAVGG